MKTSIQCRLCGRTVDLAPGSTHYRPIPQRVEKRYVGVICCSWDHANQIEETYPLKKGAKS